MHKRSYSFKLISTETDFLIPWSPNSTTCKDGLINIINLHLLPLVRKQTFKDWKQGPISEPTLSSSQNGIRCYGEGGHDSREARMGWRVPRNPTGMSPAFLSELSQCKRQKPNSKRTVQRPCIGPWLDDWIWPPGPPLIPSFCFLTLTSFSGGGSWSR